MLLYYCSNFISLETGTIPDDWKKAYVTPIFKSGNHTCPRNYHPISLTSIISKVMEHILASNIMHHLDTNFILSETQHGFRHSQSCETQLILLTKESKLTWSYLTLLRLLTQYHTDIFCTNLIGMVFVKILTNGFPPF